MVDVTLVPIFVAAVFMLMIIPGPDMLFVTANALGGGVRTGMAAMLGVASGAYLHIPVSYTHLTLPTTSRV